MANSNERAYEKIREAIIFGEYPPGTRLAEVELSSRYQMSRTPIREALKRLAGEGLVSGNRRGLAVKQFSRSEIAQAYDVRGLLEGYAAAEAAKYATDEDVAELERINQAYDERVADAVRATNQEDYGDYIKLVMRQNSLFHEAILRYSGNEHLAFLVSKVMVLPLVFRAYFWFDRNNLRSSTGAHALLVTAISRGETERARSAMTEHVYRGRDFVLKHLDDAEVQVINARDGVRDSRG